MGDYFNLQVSPETDWLDLALSREPVGLTDLILCEVLQGLRRDEDYAHVQRELTRPPVFSTGGQEIAIAAAENFRTLRKRGVTVRKTIDCLIATFCILDWHELLHRDRDFEAFRAVGLSVITA